MLQAGKGSGLGLYIAKGICEQHGGMLSAFSEGLGKGSSFTVTIPLYYVPDDVLVGPLQRLRIGDFTSTASPMSSADDVLADGETDTISNPEKRKRRDDLLRILVVDDAEMNRKLLSRLLTNRGHHCDRKYIVYDYIF